MCETRGAVSLAAMVVVGFLVGCTNATEEATGSCLLPTNNGFGPDYCANEKTETSPYCMSFIEDVTCGERGYDWCCWHPESGRLQFRFRGPADVAEWEDIYSETACGAQGVCPD